MEAKTLQRKYQNQNREIAEEKYKQKSGLNDKQSINLEELNEACDLTRKMNGLTITKNNSVDLTASVERKILAVN